MQFNNIFSRNDPLQTEERHLMSQIKIHHTNTIIGMINVNLIVNLAMNFRHLVQRLS